MIAYTIYDMGAGSGGLYFRRRSAARRVQRIVCEQAPSEMLVVWEGRNWSELLVGKAGGGPKPQPRTGGSPDGALAEWTAKE